jgi:AraC-like DNA-binding protein
MAFGSQMTAPALFEPPERWRVHLGAAFCDLVPEPLEHKREPEGVLHGAELGQVGMFTVSGTPQVVRRTTRAVRQEPGDYIKVCVQLRGRATVHQDDREIRLNPGQLAVYDTGRPYALRLDGAWSCAVMAVPRGEFKVPGTDLDRAMARMYPADHGPGLVLAGFVVATVSQITSTHPIAAAKIGEAGASLLAGTLADDGNLAARDAHEDLRRHVIAYIRSHLDDPRLSRSNIAAAHHMSLRTLDRLFGQESWSVSDYVRNERLEAVRRDLENPSLLNRSVAALAARWCFVDAAHFSRVFRQRYGYPPSHARASG